MNERKRVGRIITWMAGAVALGVALIIPLAYFVVSYEHIKGNLESEAEINSRLISGIINANPDLWRYEYSRLGELLARRPQGGAKENRRILDLEGKIVVESSGPLASPLMKGTHELKDDGVTVGRIEISRSLFPALIRTGLMALLGLAIGLTVFITLRVLPIRAVERAEEQLRRLNEELEQKVGERTKQLLEAQEALVRKEKLATLGQLAGSVGHELRNPLGVMNNAVYYLQTVLSDDDETVREYLNIIKSEISGAERIVSDLLDAVRTKPPHPQLVSAEDVIRISLEKCRMPENVTVGIQSETQRAVSVDPLQMKQVFINLINNAVDAMPEGGGLRIFVGEDCENKTIIVKFKDEGAGIAPENVAKLFQPLFTTKARGIGLGLIVVKNLTEANGGKISVESEPGKGATFTVTLPVAADEAQA